MTAGDDPWALPPQDPKVFPETASTWEFALPPPEVPGHSGISGPSPPRSPPQKFESWGIAESESVSLRAGVGEVRGEGFGGFGFGGGEPGRERQLVDVGSGDQAEEFGEQRGVRENR